MMFKCSSFYRGRQVRTHFCSGQGGWWGGTKNPYVMVTFGHKFPKAPTTPESTMVLSENRGEFRHPPPKFFKEGVKKHAVMSITPSNKKNN